MVAYYDCCTDFKVGDVLYVEMWDKTVRVLSIGEGKKFSVAPGQDVISRLGHSYLVEEV